MQGVRLHSDQTLGDLHLVHGDFLVGRCNWKHGHHGDTFNTLPYDAPYRVQVALEGRRNTSEHAPGPSLAPNSPGAINAGSVPPSSPGQLDSLLPGYLSRPYASPRKKRGASQQEIRSDAILSFRPAIPGSLVSNQTPPFANTPPGAVLGVVSGVDGELGPWTVPLNDAAGLARLLVPPVLQRLEAVLTQLALHYSFLVRNHIQPTWETLRKAIEAAATHESSLIPNLEEVRTIAALCPEILQLQSHDPNNRKSYRSLWQNRTLDVRQATALRAAAAEAEAPTGVIPHPSHITTDGAGTLIFKAWRSLGESGDEHTDYVVCLTDPWQVRAITPVPAAFIEEFHGARRSKEQQNDSLGCNNELTDDDIKSNDSLLLRKNSRSSKKYRMAWALRTAGLRAVLYLQDMFLSRNPSLRHISLPTSDRRSRQYVECRQNAEAENSNADAATFLTQGKWHPAFRVEKVTLKEILEGAAGVAHADSRLAAEPGAHGGTDVPLPVNEQHQAKRTRTTAPPQMLKKYPPCMDRSPLSAPRFVDHLKTLPSYKGQAVHVEQLPERPSRFAVLTPPPPSQIVLALNGSGVTQLYSHQVEAITALRAKRHVVVSTATASGKSMCYTVPIMEAIVADASSCAICMYPTKALAQDQLRALRAVMHAAFGDSAPAVEIYDGDTPMSQRSDVRERVQVLLTNPDMLHASVLPSHPQFARILANLKYVVVDEAHIYRGVFGSHTALVLRRLRRLCKLHGTDPTFALTTATVANPAQHACALLGVHTVDVVTQDGSPCSAKQFVLWNPPLLLESGRGSTSGSKRAAQEASRVAVRNARQERYAGTLLGPETQVDVWNTAVALGPSDAKVKPRRRAHAGNAPTVLEFAQNSASVDATGVQLESRLGPNQRRLAERASAAVSATISRSAGGLGAASVVLKKPTLPEERGLIRLGGLPNRVVAGSCSSASGKPAHAMPTGPEWKARHGSAGVADDARRASPIVEMSILLAEAVQHNLRTIAFCKTRKLSELVAAYVREILATTAPELEGTVAVYRSGYSPEERRDIEAALFSGKLRAVAATNALELGVDIGGLDATLHLGFPGSVASLWQQSGRAGRREHPSVSIYVGWDGPLDQFFFNDPSKLFGRPIEAAAVDPYNRAALEAHLTCAAAEFPLNVSEESSDAGLFGPGLPAVVTSLARQNILGRHPNDPITHYRYTGPVDAPAGVITLRAIDPERFSIIDESANGALLEEVEESKAFYQVYDGAVYMFQGRAHLCKHLDLDARVAIVRPADVKYYTRTVDFTRVTVVGGQSAYEHLAQSDAQNTTNIASLSNSPTASVGPAVVTTRWMGFVRIWRGTGQVFDRVDLFLPDVQYETEAVYIRLPAAARRAVAAAGVPFRDGVHAAAHAVLNALPVFLMCNAQDVGTECDNPYDTQYKPERILLYDKHPGGIGLASAARPIFPSLLRAALDLIKRCDCENVFGCPGCIQHTDCGEYNAVLNKQAGRLVLEAVLQEAEGN